MGINELRKIMGKRAGLPDEAPAPVGPEPSKGSKQKWFAERRVEMTGKCQCGCGNDSSKLSDQYFRHSAAHIFPKAAFPSVALHPANWVERAFWGGCHTNMDEKSIELWPNFADWQDIRTRFFILEPLLTREEKAKKFYKALKKLVKQNP